MSYPYQKIITIGQRPRRDKENLFATVNIDALREAMERLNGNSGLLLWLYLDKNADGYRLELS